MRCPPVGHGLLSWGRAAVVARGSQGNVALVVLPVEGGRRHMISVSPGDCGRGKALGPPNSAFNGSVVFILSLEKPNICVKKPRLAH